MTAITKSFTSIADSAVDPDSPIDTALVTSLRDNAQHLREWLGASFYAGAVQDHNHDGVNSALMEVGPNYVRNGSFESGTAGWGISPYTGGSSAVDATHEVDGAQCLAVTSTVLANGGASVTSNAYIPVTGNGFYRVSGIAWGSVANLSASIAIIWYDATLAQISATYVLNTVDLPTTATINAGVYQAPSTARFARVQLIGPVPASGTATGTVYFDGILFTTASNVYPVPIGLQKWGGSLIQNSTLFLGAVGDQTTGAESQMQMYVGYPMTISNLFVKMASNIPASNSAVFTLRKNGTDTALTCTVAAGVATANDTAHSVSFAVGDTVAIKVVTGATMGTIYCGASFQAVIFGTNVGCPWVRYGGQPVTTGPFSVGESIHGPYTAASSTQVPVNNAMLSKFYLGAMNGTINAQVRRNTGLADGTIATRQVNSTATNLSSSGQVSIDEFFFAQTDLLDIANGAGGASSNMVGYLLFLDVSGQGPVKHPILFSAINLTQATTAYMGGYGTPFVAVQANAQFPMPRSGMLRNLLIATDAAPAAGQTLTVTVQKNGTDTDVTAQITSAGRTAFNTTHALAFVAGDLISLKVVSSATVGTRQVNASLEFTQ